MFLFDLVGIESKIKELHEQTLQDGFWSDIDESSKVLTEIKRLEKKKNDDEAIKKVLIERYLKNEK